VNIIGREGRIYRRKTTRLTYERGLIDGREMVVSLVCKERGLINLCARYTHERFPRRHHFYKPTANICWAAGRGGLICWPENGERGVYGQEPTSMILERETGIWARKCRA
jgi:hypothetical protein